MQIITVTGGNLFDIANRMLGDATQWYLIAAANAIRDPWLEGVVTLTIPDSINTGGAAIAFD